MTSATSGARDCAACIDLGASALLVIIEYAVDRPGQPLSGALVFAKPQVEQLVLMLQGLDIIYQVIEFRL